MHIKSKNDSLLLSILDKKGLNYNEYLFLIMHSELENLKEYKETLINKGFLKLKDGELTTLKKAYQELRSIELSYNYVKIKNRKAMEKEKEAKYFDLAVKLQELYPKGKRPGSSVQWRSNKFILARKLKIIHDDYEVPFTEEQAIDATKRYVDSFNGDFTYMECLEYFILRLRPEFKSNFMSYLENTESDEDTTDFNIKIR